MRVLVLHKTCSIIKAMVDQKLLPQNLLFPVTLYVTESQLTVEWEEDSGSLTNQLVIQL